MRMGEDTREDRELINKRVVGSSLTLPEHAPDACFACSTNKERNGVTAATFKNKAVKPKTRGVRLGAAL